MMNIPEKELHNLCRNHPIKRLSLFGSALTDRFTAQSDVDVLACFDDSKVTDWFDSFFAVRSDLETLFGHPVDLVIEKPFRNSYFGKAVEETKRIVYEA